MAPRRVNHRTANHRRRGATVNAADWVLLVALSTVAVLAVTFGLCAVLARYDRELDRTFNELDVATRQTGTALDQLETAVTEWENQHD